MTDKGPIVIPYLDSIAGRGEQLKGLVLDNPLVVEPAPAHPDDDMSWIYLLLMALFCVVAIRFHKSPHFIKTIAGDLTDTRERGNVFDDTVRETTLLVLLLIMWSLCAGVMLWSLIRLRSGIRAEYSFGVPDSGALGTAICMAVFVVYSGAMMLAYWVVGRVFSDGPRTQSWIKGAGATAALQTFAFYPIALLLLCQPQWTPELLCAGAAVFIMGKLVFIFKGFRIFFTRFSSWLVFLYYLCSLEIVPLILTYVASLYLCSIML